MRRVTALRGYQKPNPRVLHEVLGKFIGQPISPFNVNVLQIDGGHPDALVPQKLGHLSGSPFLRGMHSCGMTQAVSGDPIQASPARVLPHQVVDGCGGFGCVGCGAV